MLDSRGGTSTNGGLGNSVIPKTRMHTGQPRTNVQRRTDRLPAPVERGRIMYPRTAAIVIIAVGEGRLG